jgi:hypothetical protein
VARGNKGNENILEILSFFYVRQAHNMAIMLHPHFKALHIVENLMGHKNAI